MVAYKKMMDGCSYQTTEHAHYIVRFDFEIQNISVAKFCIESLFHVEKTRQIIIDRLWLVMFIISCVIKIQS